MKKEFDVLEKIFMIVALCEAFFFVLFIMAGDDRYKVMCMTGVVVAGATAVIMTAATLLAQLKIVLSDRRAARRALGKHGLRVLWHGRGRALRLQGNPHADPGALS